MLVCPLQLVFTDCRPIPVAVCCPLTPFRYLYKRRLAPPEPRDYRLPQFSAAVTCYPARFPTLAPPGTASRNKVKKAIADCSPKEVQRREKRLRAGNRVAAAASDCDSEIITDSEDARRPIQRVPLFHRPPGSMGDFAVSLADEVRVCV